MGDQLRPKPGRRRGSPGYRNRRRVQPDSEPDETGRAAGGAASPAGHPGSRRRRSAAGASREILAVAAANGRHGGGGTVGYSAADSPGRR